MDELSIRVGTWNVRSASREHNAARLDVLLAENCDVLVLTETNDELALPDSYKALTSEYRPGARRGGRWVTIWSKRPGAEFQVVDPVRTTAAALEDGIIIFGTVLPWKGELGPDYDLAAARGGWDEFGRVTSQQSLEWSNLRKDHPGKLLIVAGDLNQSLGAPNWYGTNASRKLLRNSFEAVGLTCLTDGDHLPEKRLKHPPIDHVCAVAPVGGVVWGTDWAAWEGETPEGIKLSDHSGVAVTVHCRPPASAP
ncbi:endonuclease/exonuclease/phosphatase family protein [Blastococcus goldschmidtiae]|uniref:Endonuclease/exonuclease/phosphatase family protein n=1 Tax=Blastococcus goldschmidtiae TaxID=3075546 RepID=A0ABU2KBN6_9ACTN|nr:endonuclease/exonuclease/phosphatase family protein [Blastococcus sp. DSM 46792]MDT0277587.1 endonuclease/exonuclease/phosphatase family protein [Blastococcus sp. DSM 46792]